MPTRLFLRDALVSTTRGRLPTTKQNAVAVNIQADAYTVNRSMTPQIGTLGTLRTTNTNAVKTAQTHYYTRFVSIPLNQQSIAANTWTINLGARQGNLNANFPVATNGASWLSAFIYVWRPATNSIVGWIANNVPITGVNRVAMAATGMIMVGSVAGQQVTCEPGDVICWEVQSTFTQSAATAYYTEILYDGTTVNETQSAQIPWVGSSYDHAAFIQTPEDLSFTSANVSAVSFNAAQTQYVNCGSNAVLKVGETAGSEASYSLWFKISPTSIDHHGLLSWSLAPCGMAIHVLRTVGFPGGYINCDFQYNSKPVDWGNTAYMHGDIFDNKWHHVVVSNKASGQGQIWLDGLLSYNNTAADYFKTSTGFLNIGGYYVADDPQWRRFADCEIDDVRIYNAQLTQAEVWQLASGLDVTRGLQARFALDENTGTTTTSRPPVAPNAITATLVNGPTWFTATQWLAPPPMLRVVTERILNYALRARLRPTKTLQYGLRFRLGLARTLVYRLNRRVVPSSARTLTYALRRRQQTQRTMQYWLRSRQQTQRTLQYQLRARQQLQQVLQYRLLKRLPAETSTKVIHYNLAKRLTPSLTLRYSLMQRVATLRSFRYSLLLRLPSTRTVTYALLVQIRVATTKILRYALVTRTQQSQTARYQLYARRQTQQTSLYWLLARRLTSRTLQYSLLVQIRVQTDRLIQYALVARRQTQRTLQYALLMQLRVMTTRALTYHLLARRQTQSNLIYQLRLTVKSVRTGTYALYLSVYTLANVRYSLKAQVKTARTNLYYLRARRQTQRTFAFTLLQRVPSLTVTRYALLARLVIQQRANYQLFAKVKKITTLIYELGFTLPLNRVQTARFLLYQLSLRQQIAQTLAYYLRRRVQPAKEQTLRYHLLVRVVDLQPHTITYALKKALQTRNTLQYDLIARLQASSILKYSIFARLQASTKLSYSLLIHALTLPSTLTYSLMKQIRSDNTIKYQLIARLAVARTIRYQLYSFYELVRVQTERSINYQLRSPFRRAWKPKPGGNELGVNKQNRPRFSIARWLNRKHIE